MQSRHKMGSVAVQLPWIMGALSPAVYAEEVNVLMNGKFV